jgi:hypothetical protein
MVVELGLHFARSTLQSWFKKVKHPVKPYHWGTELPVIWRKALGLFCWLWAAWSYLSPLHHECHGQKTCWQLAWKPIVVKGLNPTSPLLARITSVWQHVLCLLPWQVNPMTQWMSWITFEEIPDLKLFPKRGCTKKDETICHDIFPPSLHCAYTDSLLTLGKPFSKVQLSPPAGVLILHKLHSLFCVKNLSIHCI